MAAMRRAVSQRVRDIPKSTVFSLFTALANEHKAVNLGQGFPDYRPDDFVLQAVQAACSSENPLVNQYSRSQGLPRLCETLARYYSQEFRQPVDAMGEVLVTIGATEALFCAIMSLVDPGDEVIVIEPFYDMYPADTLFAGGTPVYVPLRPHPPPPGRGPAAADWRLDPAELAAAVSPRTKLLVVNTPQNVPGKVWTMGELEAIADLAKRHDFLVVADQVYEKLVLDPEQSHVHIAALPGMRERTLTIGSAGKTFSVTGWKVGWVVGPRDIVPALHASHILIPFCSITPLQEAVAAAMDAAMAPGDGYFDRLRERFTANHALLAKVLREAGLPVITPQGGYFAVCDIGHIPRDRYLDPTNDEPADFHFCRWLTKEYGVTCIPLTPFFCTAHHPMADHYVRFAACKQQASIEEAGRRLRGAFTQYLPDP